MAALYIDEDVSELLAPYLRSLGYDAVNVRQLHQRRLPDYRHLLYAAQEKRIRVTHNGRDFRDLHGAWILWSEAWQAGAEHAGILIIEQRANLTVRSMGDEILRLVQEHPSPRNRLFTFERGIWSEEIFA
jgi:hypothetical protein